KVQEEISQINGGLDGYCGSVDTSYGVFLYFDSALNAMTAAEIINRNLTGVLVAKLNKRRRPTIMVKNIHRDLTKERNKIVERIKTSTDYLSDTQDDEITYVREYGKGTLYNANIILAVSPRVYQLICNRGFRICTDAGQMN